MIAIHLLPFPFRGVPAPYLGVFYQAMSKLGTKASYILSEDYLQTEALQARPDQEHFSPDLENNLKKATCALIPRQQMESFVGEYANHIEAWRAYLTEEIPALTKIYKAALKKLLAKNKIDAVITWCNCPSLVRACGEHGIKVVHQEWGSLRQPWFLHTIYFDFSGVNGNTEAETRYLKARKQEPDIPVYPRGDLLSLFSERVVQRNPTYKYGIALQVEDDSNMIAYANGFDSVSLLNHVRGLADAGGILVRDHPVAHFSYRKTQNYEPVADGSFSSLEFLGKIGHLQTINSSIGVEALLNGIPVSCVGDAPWKFIATQEMDSEEFNRRLSFYCLNYLVPEPCLFDESYIAWRLGNPSETEIQAAHMKILVDEREKRKKGLPGFRPLSARFAQLFVDTGAGYSEQTALARAVVEGRQELRFEALPKPASIRSLRFDPVNDSAVIRLNQAYLQTASGKQLFCKVSGHNATHADGATYYFDHGDPQFLLEIPERTPANAVTLVADLEFTAMGAAALDATRQAEIARIVSERDALLADKDTAWSARLEQTAKDFEAEIARIVSERDVEINRLHSCVLEREARITQLDRKIADMLSSHSWCITAPLRWASRSVRIITHDVRGIPRNLLNSAERLYRALPLPASFRRKFAHFVFASTGSLFADRYSYRCWKESRSVQTAWSPLPATATATAAKVLLTQTQKLPVADGSWEWHDYDAVKSRIAQLKAQQLAQVAPVPQQIVDIGDEPFVSAAARIRLPEVPDEPDVSIILPVFNNLKLTIECLLSISVHVAPGVSFEVLLAEDASTDETVEVLSRVKNLRILRNPENLGFLRNCNNALQHVRGRYVLYLNNDVQVTDGWLTSLYETFFKHTNVGAVGPRFVYPSGHLQEAGVAFRHDATADMVGLNDDPAKPRYNYVRQVDYISGACLMLPTELAKQLGGFSEEFLPCYCEDSDLCLRLREAGYDIYYNPASTVIHHLSKTTAAFDSEFKLQSIAANMVKLQKKWTDRLDASVVPKTIAFYLPQFHPFPENNLWWGEGFTEWTNVTKAQPNFVGHYQPRLPADLGFYDLRLIEVMEQQAALARRYGVHGFCFYYYWFGGKRLLERPIEQMLASGKPDMPFCLCWANENWSRRWDGQDSEILMAQSHSEEDDEAVILDLIRYFRDPRYISVDGRPMILVYRVTLFPDFAATAARWRKVCREQGIGEIYIAMVESMALVHANRHPGEFGCDAAVEFPPLEMADQKPPSGEIINPKFAGAVADYRDIAVRYAVRDFPGYTRFKGVMPGWDNTARRQNNSFCFEHATPGAFQAWLEETFEQTRQQHYGDERLVFINAWNEWAEGAYLEPDRRFGHSYLEALKNATEAARLLRRNKYWHGN